MGRVSQLNQCLEVYSQSDWADNEKVIQDHKDAMFCQDVESVARFSFFAIKEVYELAASYPADGVSDSDFRAFESLVSGLKKLLESLVRVSARCDYLGHPLEDLEKVKLSLEEISILSENLKECASTDERWKYLEDFVDLVDSDAITSDPQSQYLPWSDASHRAA